jgi:hypothetical protein
MCVDEELRIVVTRFSRAGLLKGGLAVLGAIGGTAVGAAEPAAAPGSGGSAATDHEILTFRLLIERLKAFYAATTQRVRRAPHRHRRRGGAAGHRHRRRIPDAPRITSDPGRGILGRARSGACECLGARSGPLRQRQVSSRGLPGALALGVRPGLCLRRSGLSPLGWARAREIEVDDGQRAARLPRTAPLRRDASRPCRAPCERDATPRYKLVGHPNLTLRDF